MKPNIEDYNPMPNYLRYLIEKSGYTQNLAGKLIGVNTDNFRKMLTGKIKAPYWCNMPSKGLLMTTIWSKNAKNIKIIRIKDLKQ